MIQWATVAEALRDWVVAESGLVDGVVIWQEKEGGRPTQGRYISLRMTSGQSIGQEWTQYKDADSPTAGAELQTLRQGYREAVLTLVCYAAKTDAIITAMGTLEKVLGGYRSYKRAFKEVGVAVLGVDRIQSIDGNVGLSFEARAIATVRLSLASNVAGFETYIEKFELTGTVEGEDDPIIDETITL